jgi:hypothetical protein
MQRRAARLRLRLMSSRLSVRGAVLVALSGCSRRTASIQSAPRALSRMVSSVLIGKGMHTVNLRVTFDTATAERGIHLVVASVEENQTIETDHSSVVASLWREGTAVVRGAILHSGSGTVAYFQGTDMLLRIAEALNVRLQS